MSYPPPPQGGAWPSGQGQYPGQPQYPGMAPQPQYPGVAPQPQYPGTAPQPSYPGTAPQPPYPGAAPHPHQYPVPPPRPGGVPLPPPKSSGTGLGCLAAVLGVFGVLGMLGGGFLVSHAYSNHSQVISNGGEYGPTMWRNEPADAFFPEVLAPVNSATENDPKRATWHRLGISEDTKCEDGLNKVTAAAVRDLDCEAVLRATYVDPTGNTVGTVSVIVLPEGGSAQMTEFFEKDADKLDPEVGAKPYAVPGTVAAKWSGVRSNGGAGMELGGMPYVLVASTGAVDGRKAGELPGEWGSHSWSAGDDRAPWRGAAKALCDDMEVHLMNLLRETS